MINGETKSGFKFRMNEETLDDYDLFEAICEIDGGNVSKIPSVINRLLGAKQKEELKKHVETENGRVPAGKMIEEIMEIFATSNNGKNS